MTNNQIKPEEQSLFGTAESLDAAYQEMRSNLNVADNELFPLVMKYQNTLIQSLNKPTDKPH